MDEDDVIEQNQNLVHHILRRYFPTYTGTTQYDYDDLFQIGMMALLKAHRTFNANSPYKFSTYAFHVIRNSLRHFLNLARNRYPAPSSLNRPIAADVELADIIADNNYENSFNYTNMLTTLQPFLTNAYFTPTELKVTRLIIYGFEGQTEIGNLLGISHTGVYKALQKIRRIIRDVLDGVSPRDMDNKYRRGSKNAKVK